MQVSDLDYLHKLSEFSEGSMGTEGDEEDLLEEDTSGWDVFDDFHKF